MYGYCLLLIMVFHHREFAIPLFDINEYYVEKVSF